jgi:hypothetical protein
MKIQRKSGSFNNIIDTIILISNSVYNILSKTIMKNSQFWKNIKFNPFLNIKRIINDISSVEYEIAKMIEDTYNFP